MAKKQPPSKVSPLPEEAPKTTSSSPIVEKFLVVPENKQFYRFGAIFALMAALAYLLPGFEWVKSGIIKPLASIQASLGGLVAPLFTSEFVSVEGTSIVSRYFAIDVSYGCDGFDVILLSLAGVIALPAIHWTKRLTGIFLVGITVFLSNILRLMALWYIGLHHQTHFDLYHREILPFVMVFVALGIFSLWAMMIFRTSQTVEGGQHEHIPA